MDTAMTSETTPLSFAKLRAWARVARTWHTKKLAQGNTVPVFSPRNPRAFRRAYIEVWLRPVVSVVEHDGVAEIHLMGEPVATLDADGAYHQPGRGSYFSLAPRVLDDLACEVMNQRFRQLQRRYDELSDQSGFDASTDERLERAFCPAFEHMQKRTVIAMCVPQIKRFVSHMQPDALRIIRSMGLTRAEYGMLLASSDPILGLRARQMFQSYPALSLFCAWENLEKFTEALNGGESMLGYMSQSLMVSKTVVRRFHGLTPQRVFGRMERMLSFRQTLPFLAELPQPLRPLSKTDFVVAMTVCELTRGWMKPEAVRAFTKGIDGPLGKDARMPGLVGIQDVEQSLMRLVGDKVTAAHLCAMSLGGLVRLNEAWHRMHREATMSVAVSDTGEDYNSEWKPLLGGHPELKNAVVVELNSPSALLEEGAAMGHCVAGYVDACRMARSRIFSVRSATGARLSTLEVGRNGKKLVVRQHQAQQNRKPCKQAMVAVQELLSQIRRGTVESIMDWPVLPPQSSNHLRFREVINAAEIDFWTRRLPMLTQLMESQRQQYGVDHRPRPFVQDLQWDFDADFGPYPEQAIAA